MPISQFDERVPISSYNTYVDPTAPGTLQLIAGAVYGTRIDQFILTWSGASPFEVDIRVDDGVGDIALLGTVTVPAAVGTELGTADVIALLLPAGQPFITIGHLETINVNTKASISGSDALTAWTSGGNF
jgi:hypothetical protein